MPNLPLIPLAFAAALLAGAALGYKWRDQSAKLHEAEEQRRYTQALNDALDKARQREHTLSAQMEAIQHDAQNQLKAATAAERAAFDGMLQQLAADYANRAARADTALAARCEAERTRAAVLANLLGELDALAQSYATEADRRMIAGKACEQAYDTAKQGASH